MTHKIVSEMPRRRASKALSRISVLGLSACLSLFMAACTSILPDPKPADTVYRLPVMAKAVTANAGVPTVRIDRPLAASALRTDEIILTTQDQQLASAQGAVWAETIPVLIQRALTDTLGARPDLVGLLPNSGARTQYRITLNIRRFEANFDRGMDTAPLAIADFGITVSNAGTRDLIGTYDVYHTHRASASTVSEIVRAQSRANQAALDEVSDWLIQRLRTAS